MMVLFYSILFILVQYCLIGDNDQRDQDELVEEMIAAGCDVLCVNLVDRTAPSDIIKAARQEKIPVIFFNREPVKEDLMQWDQLYYVGCDAKQSGEMQGEIAADYLKAHPGADKNQDGNIEPGSSSWKKGRKALKRAFSR